MTRESGSKADLRILWMGIDDEVLVRRHRVHARGGVKNLPIQRGNSRPDLRTNANFWITIFPGSRKSIEQGALLRLPNENRKDSPIESGRLASRFKPKHDSSGDDDGHRNAWDELCKPRPNRDH